MPFRVGHASVVRRAGALGPVHRAATVRAEQEPEQPGRGVGQRLALCFVLLAVVGAGVVQAVALDDAVAALRAVALDLGNLVLFVLAASAHPTQIAARSLTCSLTR